MDYNDREQRLQVIDGIEAFLDRNITEYEGRLLEHLGFEEQKIYGLNQGVEFKGMAFYRPLHNVLTAEVALIMDAIEGVNRLVVLPTIMLHDKENAYMDVKKEGADWEDKDKRVTHCSKGAKRVKQELTQLVEEGEISLGESHINAICDIIAVHDKPYGGIHLWTDEELQVRDCDRVFVPSVVSWYKDFLAYNDNPDYLQRLEQDGFTLTLEVFNKIRLAFFYDSPINNPVQVSTPLETGLAKYNEGGSCEPMSTETGKRIADQLLVQRTLETRGGTIDNLSADGLVRYVEKMCGREMEWLHELACGKDVNLI